jgi:cytochrome b561
MMQAMMITNTRQVYGWAAIALHWISAAGVVTLYLLGERLEEAPDRAAKVAAQNLHVSVGVLLFTFLAARLLWSASQPKPAPFERRRVFQIAAAAVQVLFLLMIAVLLVTGPLAVWSTARPIQVFDLFTLPSPFMAPDRGLHELAEEVHAAASKLFWPLIVLHVAGALKHLVVDRDGTFQRMLWVRRLG